CAMMEVVIAGADNW
nr:immunoglobulin heavy chain junction region [Macaca mulatta]